MKRLLIFLLPLSLFSCQPKDSNPSSTAEKAETQEVNSTPQEPAETPLAKGEALFNNNCKSCHYKTSERMIGPGLAGITKRQNKEQIKSWITNSQQLIASGDPYAVKVYEEHNKVPMPSFPFSDEEIDALILYIDGK